MNERTVTVSLGETELEIFCGNSALRRYRKAGGSMELLDLITEENKSYDQMFDCVESALLFLQVNQTAATPLSVDDLAELSQQMTDTVNAVVEALNHTPWFSGGEPGEPKAEMTTGSAMPGPTPLSSSAGPQTSSGKSAEGNG